MIQSKREKSPTRENCEHSDENKEGTEDDYEYGERERERERETLANSCGAWFSRAKCRVGSRRRRSIKAVSSTNIVQRTEIAAMLVPFQFPIY